MELTKTGQNNGSLCKIEVVDVEDVASVPHAFFGVTSESVALEALAEWTELYHTMDTAHFVERQVGEMYELVVSWKVPKDSAVTLQYLEKTKRKRYIARLTDINKAVVIVGTLEEPCRIMHTLRDKGANMRDSNHYIIELRLTRQNPALIQL